GLGALAAGLAAALTAVSGWLIVRAGVAEYIMYLLVAIVGVRAFGVGRAAGRYAERLVTHRAAFLVVDDLLLRLWRAIARPGARSRDVGRDGAGCSMAARRWTTPCPWLTTRETSCLASCRRSGRACSCSRRRSRPQWPSHRT